MKMSWIERRAFAEQERIKSLQKRKVKAFNRLLKDKNIKTIKKETSGFYCITYKNGAQFRARGPVVDNSLIFEKRRD